MINNNLGKSFPSSAVFSGNIILLSGLLAIFFGGLILGIVISIIGFVVSFSYNGVLISPDEKIIKHYTWILGFRTGHWADYSDFTHLTFSKGTKQYKAYSRTNRSHTFKNVYFEVHLVEAAENYKVRIYSSKNKDKAHKNAIELSEKMKNI